ncbi:MAG: hypothetical protein MJ252_17660 [archaeon]|nr:hypothetical protein [archaeon]
MINELNEEENNFDKIDLTKENIEDYVEAEPDQIKIKRPLKKKRTKKLNRSFTLLLNDPTTFNYIYRFINKFYSLLLFQQISAFVFCIICLKNNSMYYFVKKSTTLFLITFIGAMLMSLGAFIVKDIYRNQEYFPTLVTVFTALFAYVNTYISLSIDKYTLMMSTLSISLILISLLFYTFSTKSNMKMSNQILIVIGCGLFHYFFYEDFVNAVRIRTLFSLIWVIFCGFYLIGWTRYFVNKSARKNVNMDDYVICSFRYYIIILFFLSLFYAMKYKYLASLDIMDLN